MTPLFADDSTVLPLPLAVEPVMLEYGRETATSLGWPCKVTQWVLIVPTVSQSLTLSVCYLFRSDLFAYLYTLSVEAMVVVWLIALVLGFVYQSQFQRYGPDPISRDRFAMLVALFIFSALVTIMSLMVAFNAVTQHY